MPRKPRIDEPGLLYHVNARGIERGRIFSDDRDRIMFLNKLGELVTETGIKVHAFALIPNHVHLLLGREHISIAAFMHRLLTAYAVHFNKRHRRAGHLFQNRYKSVICQEDIYFLELVRYINLNPVRAGIVPSLDELARWPFASHSYVNGKRRLRWFDPDPVLSFFGATKGKSRKAYAVFMAEGLSRENGTDLSGGGLKRSLALSGGCLQEKQAFDDRILGLGHFVERLVARPCRNNVVEADLSGLIEEVCKSFSITETELTGRGRAARITSARERLAVRMSKEHGLSKSDIARRFGVSHTAVAKMLDRSSEIIKR